MELPESLWALEPRALERLRLAVSQPLGATMSGRSSLLPDATLYTAEDGVAVIKFEGLVTKRPSFWGWLFGGSAATQTAQEALAAALADTAVKSVLFVVDSPGGTVAGTEELAEAVFNARKVKTVTAYASDMCASAAYWIAAQAGKVYANATATVGSIGVYAVNVDLSRMYRNEGVEVDVIARQADSHLSTAGQGFADYPGRGGEPQFLQPPDVHILQQGVRGPVGRGGGARAVPADHDPVACHLPKDRIAHQSLKVRELRPLVQLGVGDLSIEVGLPAEVAGRVHCDRINGRSRAASGAVRQGLVCHPKADLLAFLFAHLHDVDQAQEVRAFLHPQFERLRNGRRHVERLRDVLHAVDLADFRRVGGELLPGFGRHGVGIHGGLLPLG